MQVIDSYDTLPLGLYERITASGAEDENELTLEALAVLAGTTVDALLAMPIEDYYDIKAKGAFLLLQPQAKPIRPRYQCGDFALVPVRKVQELSTAQWIDFQEWCKQEGEHEPETLSCFLVPEGRKYGEGYDIADVIEAIRSHLSVADAVSLDAFFFRLSILSMHDSLRSLERRMKPSERMTGTARRLRKALRDLRRSGAGWRRWTPLLSLPARLGT